MASYYKNIRGWFDFEGFYIWVAQRLPNDGLAVEVGAFMGKSVCFLGETLNELGKGVSVFAVDTFKGTPSEPEHEEIIKEYGGNLLRIFLKNMVDGNVMGRVVPIVGESTEVAQRFQDIPVDFVFIDASHDYESVKRDIQSWLPTVRNGGMISGHDADHPPVIRAVKELIPDVTIKGSVWYYEKI